MLPLPLPEKRRRDGGACYALQERQAEAAGSPPGMGGDSLRRLERGVRFGLVLVRCAGAATLAAMKTFVLSAGWIAAVVLAALYYAELNRAPREVLRIVKVPVEVKVPYEVIREVVKPVEVVKEVPAKIPQEYIDAVTEGLTLYEAQKESFNQAVELEHAPSIPARIAAYMKVVAMGPNTSYGKAASERVAQLNAIFAQALSAK